MRKMFPALLVASLLPALAIAAPAADDMPPPPPGMHMDGHDMDRPDMGRPGKHHGMKADGPFRNLNLTAEQRRSIGKLMGEEMRQHRDITKRYLDKLPANEQQAMKDELKANREKTQKAIRDQLTPEQRKEFDEAAKKQEQRHAEWAEFQQWKKDHKSN
ncbi:Spy/CpxP family protein refolding chaperone [Pseudomonas duriflava]|uniref:Spy/CpxP family protein refolding chaperone n=1 Tax=Pseudomonas duriflava TaxID=459528 RepID=A0A562Q2U6_9PSED|nr:LTXXQ domain protein [Pseudomonas duriflava]TWI50999.1 Spy/CpxP family protein refolding chaperone [Pseudomonas duriflava]